MKADERRALEEHLELYRYAESVLGPRAHRLVVGYGRVMAGPYGGLYVSGLPASVARELIGRLVNGDEIGVHLMHRHVSGNYESSRTRYDGSRLWMLFTDRSELA